MKGDTMTTDTDTLQALAGEAYDAMERHTREDGSSYVALKPDAPAWVERIVREAHADILPDDWRYETIREAFEAIADGSEDAAEFADSGCDVYNADLLAWVGSHSSRPGYVDQARDEYGEPRDFYHGLQMGQYAEREEVFGLVLEGLSTEAGEREEAAE